MASMTDRIWGEFCEAYCIVNGRDNQDAKTIFFMGIWGGILLAQKIAAREEIAGCVPTMKLWEQEFEEHMAYMRSQAKEGD